MWLIKMAWKNMWRNPNRTLITMASIFFAVILSVTASSLKEGVFDNLVKNVVGFYTGYIQVHKQGYWDEQLLNNSFKASANLEQKILQDKNITAVAARLESFALASSEDITRGSLVVGIDPVKENQVTLLKNKIIHGRYLKHNDNSILVSQGLGKRLKLVVGDTIILIGQGYHGATAAGKYPITGIVKFGSPELNDRSLFMPLTTAQDLYSAPGMITSYLLSLDDTRDLQPTASVVRASLGIAYEVMTWEEMMPDIKQHIQSDSNNMKYVLGILYMLICFGIFGTLLMMMVERKFEMGMLVAIGMNKIKLILLVLYESILTVLAGCILGMVLSVPLVVYLHKNPIRMGGETTKAYENFGFEAIFPTSVKASIFINQGLIVLVIGLLLSLYPIYKIIRLDPVNGMRR